MKNRLKELIEFAMVINENVNFYKNWIPVGIRKVVENGSNK